MLAGRYETYEQLGKGSTGTVYRGRDTVLGREVAIRTLDGNARISSRLLGLFSSDGQPAPEWLHPNIAIVYELGKSTAGSFVVLELLAGAAMRAYIRDRRPLSLVRKLNLLAQACDGLAHAHKNGVVHGAITPGSFFIDERQQLKITGLGIRLAGGARNAEALNYLAPEQIMNDSCDVRSDLFSAALVFYEFLVNTHPFQGAFIPRRILEDSPGSLLEHDPLLPPSLEKLLNRALCKSPGDRPQTALEFAASLRVIERDVLSTLTPRVADLPRLPDHPAAALESSDENHSGARAFIELLRQYDLTLVSEKWSEARHLLQRMEALASAPGGSRFAAAIRECQNRLDHARGSEAVPTSVAIGPEAPGGEAKSITGVKVTEPPPSRQLPSRFLTPPPFGVPLFGTLVVAVLLLSAAFFASQSRPGRRGSVLAQAQVNVLETKLLKSPVAGSAPVAELRIGTWVRILDRVPSRNDKFVRVQDRRTSASGYVRLADLGEWRSDDPNAAWEVLSLTKPPEDARTDDIKQYLVDLQSYTDRFPASRQAHAANLEKKRWERALGPTPDVKSSDVKSTEIAARDQLPADKAAAVQAPAAAPQPAAPLLPQDQEKVQRLLDRMPALWNEGNLEGLVDLTQQALALSPENSPARVWRTRARKALRKLNDL
ncbi:MAG: serine/threonine protein kinase [Acidobacteriota bacterium]|nr:serine/threonine protein kinase [Acidobacteriota bacterium]